MTEFLVGKRDSNPSASSVCGMFADFQDYEVHKLTLGSTLSRIA